MLSVAPGLWAVLAAVNAIVARTSEPARKLLDMFSSLNLKATAQEAVEQSGIRLLQKKCFGCRLERAGIQSVVPEEGWSCNETTLYPGTLTGRALIPIGNVEITFAEKA